MKKAPKKDIKSQLTKQFKATSVAAQAALDYIETLEAENAKLKSANQNLQAPSENSLIVLIDGSGSMLLSSSFDYSLKGTAEVSAKLPVKTGLWGDNRGIVGFDMGNEDQMKSVKQCSINGSDLAPAFGQLSGALHVVIISDGDVFDTGYAKLATEKFLNSNKGASVDFILLDASPIVMKETTMYRLCRGIMVARSKQQPVAYLATSAEQVESALHKIAQARGLGKKLAASKKHSHPKQG